MIDGGGPLENAHVVALAPALTCHGETSNATADDEDRYARGRKTLYAIDNSPGDRFGGVGACLGGFRHDEYTLQKRDSDFRTL